MYPTQGKFDVDKLLVAARPRQHNFPDNKSCFNTMIVEHKIMHLIGMFIELHRENVLHKT